MPKRSINLLISQKDKENPLVKKLNVILPIISGVTLLIFIIAFIISLAYISNQKVSYDRLKKEVEQFESKIISQKKTEGLYTLTGSRLNILDKISANISNFASLMTEISTIEAEQISIRSATADQKGNVSLSMVASASGSLEELVNVLEDKEKSKLYSNIKARGITRDAKGIYRLTIVLVADKSTLKQ